MDFLDTTQSKPPDFNFAAKAAKCCEWSWVAYSGVLGAYESLYDRKSFALLGEFEVTSKKKKPALPGREAAIAATGCWSRGHV